MDLEVGLFRKPGIAVLGTKSRGGIRAVINNYLESGIYDGYNFYFISTHDEVSVLKRICMFVLSFFKLLFYVVFGVVQVVHVHGSYKGSIWRKFILISFVKMFKVKTVFHLHGSEFKKHYDQGGFIYKAIVKKVLNISDRVFVLSETWKLMLVKEVGVKGDVVIVNNFPSNEYESCGDGNSYSNDTVKLLFLGFLGARKGIYDLIEAVCRLSKNEKLDFHLYVGGNGEIDEVQKIIDNRNISEKITLLGWVSGEEKKKYLSECDVFVLPSYNEGLPISILEAMAAKKAVISTSVGGIPDLIENGKSGILVPAGNVDILSENIKDICLNHEKRQNMALKGYQVYKNYYSSDVVREQVRDQYAELLRDKFKKKILAISSKGGHWIQLMRLKPVFDEHNTIYISTDKNLKNTLEFENFHSTIDSNLDNKPGLFILGLQVFFYVVSIRPDVIITTGAAPGYFAVVIGKILGKKTVWIDSIANAEELSQSGKKAKAWANLWLTQWPELSSEDGPQYKGSVL